MAAVPGKKARGDCPQKRTTKEVSFKYKNKKNPLKPTPANLKAGEAWYQKKAKPMACRLCHGKHGDGKGPGGAGISPAPRNFTCAATTAPVFGNGPTAELPPNVRPNIERRLRQLQTFVRGPPFNVRDGPRHQEESCGRRDGPHAG